MFGLDQEMLDSSPNALNSSCPAKAARERTVGWANLSCRSAAEAACPRGLFVRWQQRVGTALRALAHPTARLRGR